MTGRSLVLSTHRNYSSYSGYIILKSNYTRNNVVVNSINLKRENKNRIVIFFIFCLQTITLHRDVHRLTLISGRKHFNAIVHSEEELAVSAMIMPFRPIATKPQNIIKSTTVQNTEVSVPFCDSFRQHVIWSFQLCQQKDRSWPNWWGGLWLPGHYLTNKAKI